MSHTSIAEYWHGWPLKWLDQWSNSAWVIIGQHHRKSISLTSLAVDLLIALSVIIVVAGSNEAMLRRRNRPWQYSLRTALIAMTVIGLVDLSVSRTGDHLRSISRRVQ